MLIVGRSRSGVADRRIRLWVERPWERVLCFPDRPLCLWGSPTPVYSGYQKLFFLGWSDWGVKCEVISSLRHMPSSFAQGKLYYLCDCKNCGPLGCAVM